MKAEQLKVIAEGMGYSILENLFNQWTVTKKDWSYYCEYNPLTNAEQCMEIMEKLKNEGYVLYPVIGNKCTFIKDDNKNPYKVSETIPEAICNAAYKYFKDKR